MKNALIIDDDINVRDTLTIFLMRHGFSVNSAADGESGLVMTEQSLPDIVFLDIKLPGRDGLSILEDIRARHAAALVIVITAFDSMDFTIRAMKQGAFEYLEKPLDLRGLQDVLDRAEKHLTTSAGMETNVDAAGGDAKHRLLVGNSPQMKAIFKRIGQLASNRVSVLIEGESGAGKELVARVLHTNGVTATSPFVAVNCSAIPEALLESELFGHQRGAFTGAVRDRKGRFELAEDGTVFLDEISEMSLPMQVKLLRVLQERSFEPVGAESSRTVRARIIAATNQDLTRMVREKRFREDLYFRLNVCRIVIPPLRERLSDLPWLVMHFVRRLNEELGKRIVKVPYETLELLKTHAWPGNVRELENVILQSMIASTGDVLEITEPVLTADAALAPEPTVDDTSLSLREIEERHIRLVLDSVGWNKQAALAVLGISKPTLYNKIKEYGIHPPREIPTTD